MPHDVFLSYSSHDKAIADATCAALEAQKIRCWIAPRDVLPGIEYGEAIVTAINEAGTFVIVFSAEANNSPQVRREVERAVSKGKIIVPMRIEDVLPSGAMEFALGNTHWLDAMTPPLESHLGRLTKAVSELLRIQPSGPRKLYPQKTQATDNLKPSERLVLSSEQKENSASQNDPSDFEWSWLVNLAFGFASLVNLAGSAKHMKDAEFAELLDLVLEPCQHLDIDIGKPPLRSEFSTESALSIGHIIEKVLRKQCFRFAASFTFLWQFLLITGSNSEPLSDEQAKQGEGVLLSAAQSAGLLDPFSKEAIHRLVHEPLMGDERKRLQNAFVQWAKQKQYPT